MENSFIQKNKTLITIAAVAGAAAIGASLYYYSTPTIETPKKKKSKPKKKEEDIKQTIYPVDKNGLPNLTEDIIKGLSDKEKGEWSMALKEDGNAKFKNEQFKEAIEYYTSALQLKEDPVFYSNRSACYVALKDYENVIKDTTAAIKLKPDYSKCMLRRSQAYEAVENYVDSMMDLTALSIYGGFNNKQVEGLLDKTLKKFALKLVEERIKSQQPDLPSASAIGSFFGAFKLETNPEGINEESQGGDKFLFEAIKKIKENTIEGYNEADKLIEQACESYEVLTLSKENPNAGKATIALEYSSLFKFLKSLPIEASGDLAKAFNLKPTARTYVIRAIIKADQNNFNDAQNDFKQAIKLDGENGDAYYHAGQIYYLSGDLDTALEYYEKAKIYNPLNIFAFIQSACITYKLGKIKESEDKFTEAKLKFPTSPEIPNYYGELLSDRGDVPAALKQFETAARLQKALPNFSVGALPLINQAALISRDNLEKFDEAEKLLREACEIDPKSELARISLAQVVLQKESLDEAIELFEESANLTKNFDEKVQATQFAEATKIQKRIRSDPVLTAKIAEVMRQQMVGLNP